MAQDLSDQRHAHKLWKMKSAKLADLYMDKCAFSSTFSRLSLIIEGNEAVEFSTNPGEVWPLVKVAPGWRIITLMLAIKSFFSKEGKTVLSLTRWIQEVSGRVAQAITAASWVVKMAKCLPFSPAKSSLQLRL